MSSKMRTFGVALLAAFVLGVVTGQNTVDISACSPIGPRVACGEPENSLVCIHKLQTCARNIDCTMNP